MQYLVYTEPPNALAPLVPLLIFGMTLWTNRKRGPGPQWTDLGFLYGRWRRVQVKTGQAWRETSGDCDIFALGDGKALTRRDRRAGQTSRGGARPVLEPTLCIKGAPTALSAELMIDGQVIAFTDAAVIPGESVTFTGTPRPGGPVFQLGYRRLEHDRLVSELALVAPGARDGHVVLAETLERRR